MSKLLDKRLLNPQRLVLVLDELGRFTTADLAVLAMSLRVKYRIIERCKYRMVTGSEIESRASYRYDTRRGCECGRKHESSSLRSRSSLIENDGVSGV